MTIKFKQEIEDLYSFNLYNSWFAPERKNYRLKSYLLLPTLAIAFVIYKTSQVNPEIRLAYGTNLGFGILVVILIYAFSLNSLVVRKVRKNVDKLLKTSKNEELLGAKELVLTEDGISEKGVHSTGELTWKSIEKFRFNESHYFLYLNSMMAFVIPKSAVEQQSEFESMVASKIEA